MKNYTIRQLSKYIIKGINRRRLIKKDTYIINISSLAEETLHQYNDVKNSIGES